MPRTNRMHGIPLTYLYCHTVILSPTCFVRWKYHNNNVSVEFSAFCRFLTHTVHIQCILSVPDTHCIHSVHSVGFWHTLYKLMHRKRTHFNAFSVLQPLLLHPIRKQRSFVNVSLFITAFRLRYCYASTRQHDVTFHTSVRLMFGTCPNNHQYQGLNFARI